MRTFWTSLAAGLVIGLPWQLTAQAQTPDETITIIREAATAQGVSGDALVRLAVCESTLNPRAVGDHGTSLGLFQINTLTTGLMGHFRAVGYSDALDPYQAAAYVARVAGGEWAAVGITLGRWSCWGR